MKFLNKLKQHIVVKNSLLNFGSQGLIVIFALISLPYLVKHMPPEDFGLLSLLWAVVGYFTIFDLGISRAITKFLSELKDSRNQSDIRVLIWSALFGSMIVGLIGMCVMLFSSDFLLRILHVEPESSHLAISSFYLASLGIPFMVVFGVIKGIQAAYNRFDLVNIYQTILGLFQWVGSVVVVAFGFGLFQIIEIIIFARIIISVVSFCQLPYFIPNFRFSSFTVTKKALSRLFSFGSWITLSQVLSPLYMYVDRFFIGALLSVTLVGYYTIPQEALGRLMIIPWSISLAVFPVSSEYQASADSQKKLFELYIKSLYYIALIMVPLMAFFAIFSTDILKLWVGNDVASHSSTVFTLITIGFLFNSLAQIPTTFLHAKNLPKLTAMLHVFELPVMIGLDVLLIPLLGIAGAAIASSVRMALDCLLLLIILERRSPQFRLLHQAITMKALVFWGLIFTLAFCGIYIIQNFPTKIVLFVIASVSYVIVLFKHNDAARPERAVSFS
jgi:O-antigen/teichoic acid export membrane protein